MSQIDPWEKAAECDRAMQISSDPVRRDVLKNLQEMWLILANKNLQLSEEESAREAEKIGRLHAMFAGGTPPMH
jgi:hypothetical protein